MKWFKHLSGALNDDLIFEAIAEFGGDAYLVFFGLKEIMAEEFDIHNPGINRILIKKLTKNFQLSRQKTVKILKFFEKKSKETRFKYKSFSVEFEKDYVTVTDLKLKELCDEYTEKQLKKIGTRSGQTPDPNRDKIGPKEVEAEVEEEVEIKDSLSNDKGFNTKKLENQLSDKEEIQFGSPKLITEKINMVAEELYREKIFLKAQAFVNKMTKEGKNHRAILHSLTQCLLKKPRPHNPWSYCTRIISVENGNFNEQDHNRRNIPKSTR